MMRHIRFRTKSDLRFNATAFLLFFPFSYDDSIQGPKLREVP